MDTPISRERFPTEEANPASSDLDRLSIADAFDVINAEDAQVAAAVARAKPEIVRAVEIISDRLSRGGRLFYCGAGTSGRLGVLDAAECPPTFQTDPGMVQGLIAGGPSALTGAVEGAEDSREAGKLALFERGLSAQDVVLGIAAGGTTPFVHGAIEAARERNAASIFLACVPRDLAPDAAGVSIRVIVGPEVIAGSTRLKAGTATKLVLNTLSTLAMVRLGKVHGNLMVDLDARGNAKLRARAIGLVARLAGLEREPAERVLDLSGGSVKVAVLMGRLSIDEREARRRLERAGGFLRAALEA